MNNPSLITRIEEAEQTIRALEQANQRLEQENAALSQSKNHKVPDLPFNEETYRLIAENSIDVIWKMDLQLKFMYCSPSIFQLTGYTAEEWTGTHLKDHTSQREFWKMARQAIGAVRKHETIKHTVIQGNMVCKDGSEIPVEITAKVLLDEQGDPIGVQGTTRDISKRIKSEAVIQSRLELMIFAENHSLDEVLQKILDTICGLAESPIGFYHFVESDQKTLSLQAWSTRTRAEFCQAEGFESHYPVDKAGVWADCVRKRGPLIHNDYVSLLHRKGLPDGHAKVIRELVVPIFRNDQVVAILGVGNKSIHYDQSDVELVTYFADLTWEIVERKRDEQKIHRLIQQQEAIISLALALGQSMDLESIYDTIREYVCQLVDSAAFIVSRYEIETGLIHAEYVYVDGKQHDAKTLPPITISTGSQDDQSWAIIHEEAHALQVSEKHYDWTEDNIQSVINAPLNASGQVIGVIQAQSERKDAYTEQDIELLGGLANIAAVAINNANSIYGFRQQTERLVALRTIDKAIGGSLDLRVTLGILLNEVVSQLNVDAVSVLHYNSTFQHLDYVAGVGFYTNSFQVKSLKWGKKFAGIAALQREIIQLDDLSSNELDGELRHIFELENFQAYTAVPLIAKGKIVGVLEVFHRIPHQPDANWLDFLETLAGQTAIAIDNINLFKELQQSNRNLIVGYDATIEGWAKALEYRDMETEGHSRRVVELTMQIGRAMGIKPTELVHMRRGAFLHDIGKMGIPDQILNKPGPLKEDEWEIMRQHPSIAIEMLRGINFLRAALDIPYCHHEKWDGSGYPRGLKGDQIPLSARIFAIIDVWDALLSDRTYRKAWSEEKVLAYLQEQSGKHFDPQVVDIFLDFIR